jgi:leucyl/phenylalanyl-tRNA---protein transferase
VKYQHLKSFDHTELQPDIVLEAYRQSFFPMAEIDGTLYWHSPNPRAIIPLDGVKVSRSLRKAMEKKNFEFRFDYDFTTVIKACCERRETWISEDIIKTYSEIHRLGFAHTVETWLDGELVGGLYGVAIGSAFFGESMFSRVSDASKAAFVMLTTHLIEFGYSLLDTQYINPFTEQLGAIEIPRDEYLIRLADATTKECKFV